MGEQSLLDIWYEKIQENKYEWLSFYHELLKYQISNPTRFFEAVEQYGDFPMFEAIVATSARKLKDDPLSYVLAVAFNKWSDQMRDKRDDERYKRGLERSRRQTYEKSLELAEKLKKARGHDGKEV